jgi:hypothetical protein
MKSLHFIFALFFILIVGAACTSSTPPPAQTECPSLPTPDVPPITEIDAAIERWESNNNSRYLAEIEQLQQNNTWKVRVVVVDDQIRSAQWLEKDAQGNWSEPEALPLQEAEDYSVDAVLARLRQDALGQGSAPVNLDVAFDNNLGYPRAVNAEAILNCDQNGEVILDHRNSYDLTMNVETLLEDIFGAGQEPVFKLIRSGGPDAWCDSLRIFSDGSSIYIDECQQEIVNLMLSTRMLEELDNLRASFGSMDDLRETKDSFQRITITGTAAGTPDAASSQASWAFSESAVETLSTPIGLGLTLLYVQAGELNGFDIFNQITQPADLYTRGRLFGAILSTDGQSLAYGDEAGLNLLVPQDGQTENLLEPPERGYLNPRLWSDTDHLLVENVLEESENEYTLGWTSLDARSWHDLPPPDGASGYGCDSGATWSPQGSQLAIGGLEYGSPCNLNAGLTVVDIKANTAERIVDLTIDSGDGSTITAGVHSSAWSPDGAWIAFGLDQDADQAYDFPTQLHIVRPDGSQLTSLTDNTQGIATYPVWSPDGTLYYAKSGVSASEDGIYTYNIETETHTLVIAGSNFRPLSISPDGQFLVYGIENGLMLWGFAREELIPVTPVQSETPAAFSGWLDLSE